MISTEQLLKLLNEIHEHIKALDAERQPLAVKRRRVVTILRERGLSDRQMSMRLGQKGNWVSSMFKREQESMLKLKFPVKALAEELGVTVADLREWFPEDLAPGVLEITEPVAEMIRDAVSRGPHDPV